MVTGTDSIEANGNGLRRWWKGEGTHQAEHSDETEGSSGSWGGIYCMRTHLRATLGTPKLSSCWKGQRSPL